MVTKRRTSSGSPKGRPTAKAPKRAAKAPAKPAAKPAKTAAARPAAKPTAPKAKAPSRPAPAATSLLDRAEQLREAIQRSKLTHPDPWSYTAKARGWGERAEVVIVQLSQGDESAAARALETLLATVEADRDFQEARRLF